MNHLIRAILVTDGILLKPLVQCFHRLIITPAFTLTSSENHRLIEPEAPVKTLILLLFILLWSNTGQSFEKDQKKLPTLVVAIYDFPPHVMVDPKNTKPTGA